MARRRLVSGVPRAFPDHRRVVARAYREAVAEIRRRLSLNGYGGPLLREYGLVATDLQRLHEEAEALQGKPRCRRELARVQRRRVALRSQLVTLERRLEELATGRRPTTNATPAALLERVRAEAR